MISVIVPVCNVEAYVDKCIESIVKQTYADLEIILVDDGSTDGSGGICDKWQVVDRRIRVIHQENGGLSKARNVGLTVCTGEYIAFVDSDDFLHPQAYELMMKAMENTGADLALCREYAFEDGEQVVAGKNVKDSQINVETKEQLLLHFMDEFPGLVTWTWNKLYRRELLKDLFFEEGVIIEDVLFSVAVALRIRTAVCLEDRLYFYRQRQESIMKCQNPERLLRCAMVAEKEFRMLTEVLAPHHSIKAYNCALGRIAGYAASSYNQKEESCHKIEVIYRQLYDSIKLKKKWKWSLVRYFPKAYYLWKSR